MTRLHLRPTGANLTDPPGGAETRPELADHISTRVDSETVARLDALAPRIAPPGAKPVRSIATRACILAGLDVLEARLAEPPGTP